MTRFPEPGFNEIGPNWFITVTFACGPTVKRNSFLLSAIAIVATDTTTTTAKVAARWDFSMDSLFLSLLNPRMTVLADVFQHYRKDRFKAMS